jgi:plastocyanin
LEIAMNPVRILPALLLSLSLPSIPVQAAEPEVTIVIREHRFEPAQVKIPAGQKVKLLVKNEDPTPEEFESHELNREKVIAGKSSATIWVGPLKPGRYPFFGEFHEKTAQGALIVD